ncbi:conserved hypothetical protein, membrane [methanotrophic bacterial endosymbiont of Bathymodiolus sp.]|nr:conserved hypothetical protein, membrane [methanotrophic bacterial endosymbiont of Bathymodiolus sp.]
MFKQTRAIIGLVLIIVLLATNILTLSNSRTHDVLYGFIARLPFSSLKKNSPTSRHKKLLKENTLIKKDVSSLKQKNIKLSKGVNKAKQLSRVISKRTFRNVSKNIAAISAEAVPYIGVGTMLAVTAMDIKDACDTMKDMDNLLIALGVAENSDETVKICGKQIPQSDYVVSQLKVKQQAYAEMQENMSEFLNEVKEKLSR